MQAFVAHSDGDMSCFSCRCLFEIFSAVRNDVPVTVQLGADDVLSFRERLNMGGGLSRVQEVLEDIDVRAARATVPEDYAMIMREIEETTGIDPLNALVRETLFAEFQRVSAVSVL